MAELDQKLAQSPGLLALQLQGREAARLVPRETGVPAGYLALTELPDGRMAVVPAGADPNRESVNNITLFRAGPIPLSMKVQPLRTSDGHDVSCSLILRVAVRPNVNHLNGLAKEFTKRNKNKPEIDISEIIQYLEEHVLVAARVFARGRSTTEILAPTTIPALVDYVGEALERPLLSVGLALVPGMLATCLPVSEAAISFLPTGAAAGPVAQEILHKALLGQFEDLAGRAAACGEDKVGEALRKLRDKVAGQTAFATFDQVMQVLPERLRTELYDALLKLFAADAAERLVAVAASQVICWKLPETDRPTWNATLSSDLGGCRSVRLGRDLEGKQIVLVGCQKGVALLDASTGSMMSMLIEPYRGPAAGAKEGSGFNAAVLRRRQCWASKSDVGLLCWELDRPESALRGAGSGP